MKTGMSTSCLYPQLTETSLEKLGKNGIKTAEIFFNSYGELEPDFVNMLKCTVKRYGMRVISVHPTFSLAESFVFFSAYGRRFEEGLDIYRRYAEIVCELGGKYIIMHGGKPNRVLTNEEYFDRFGTLAEILNKNGAVLLQENVVKFRAGDLEALTQMSNHLGDSAAFCLDIKQSLRGGYSPLEVLERLGKKVKHLHISDNRPPEYDCMLPLTGTFDFAAFFEKAKAVGYEGDAVVEVYSDCYDDESKLFSSYKKFDEK